MIRPHPRSTHFPYTTLFRSTVSGTSATQAAAIGTSGSPATGTIQNDDTAVFTIDSPPTVRSEEHTSELQSLRHFVCRHLPHNEKLDGATAHEKAAQGSDYTA